MGKCNAGRIETKFNRIYNDVRKEIMQERKFEDKVSVEDLFKKDTKEILIMTYMQAVKTNSQVAENIKNIEENAICVKDIKTELKDKIGIKLFKIITIISGALLVAFNVWDRVQNFYGG